MGIARELAESALRRPETYDKWCYERGVFVRALIDLADAERDAGLFLTAKMMTDRFVREDGSIDTYPPETYNLDMICFGRVLPMLFAQTGDARYEKAAAHLLAQLKDQPRTVQGGFWHKLIYPAQMWLDGIYMASPFLCAMGDYDEAARQVLLIAAHTRDEASGLHRHGWDAAHAQRWADPHDGRAMCCWGRANGWFALALCDVLQLMPRTHSSYAAVRDVLAALMEAALRYRVDGVWYQLLDRAGEEGNYKEASGTAMLGCALARGAEIGALPASMRKDAVETLTAIEREFVTRDENGAHLNRICRVAGLGGSPYRDGTPGYYYGEPICQDDAKGIAAVIMLGATLGM